MLSAPLVPLCLSPGWPSSPWASSCHGMGKAGTGSLSRGRGQPLLWPLSVSGLLRAIKTIWSNTKTHGQTEAQRGRDSELRLNRSPTPSLVRFHLPESVKQGPSTITGGGGGG